MSLVDVRSLSQKRCAHPIEGELAYATKENFLGRIVEGYHPEAKGLFLLTNRAAHALCEVQNELIKQGLGLFIYDAYRPLRAVKDFCAWAKEPDTEYGKERKKIHYPNLQKQDLFKLGYIADKVSRHCYGNTVDLTIIHLDTKEPLDMGAVFDEFDEVSHQGVKAEVIGEEAFKNRELLYEVMQKHGFVTYPYEWWDFEFPNREVEEPMDFEITPYFFQSKG